MSDLCIALSLKVNVDKYEFMRITISRAETTVITQLNSTAKRFLAQTSWRHLLFSLKSLMSPTKFLNPWELFVNPVSIYLQKLYEHYIFFSFIHTFFYCNLVWASAYKTNLILLEILQQVIRTQLKPLTIHILTQYSTSQYFKIS